MAILLAFPLLVFGLTAHASSPANKETLKAAPAPMTAFWTSSAHTTAYVGLDGVMDQDAKPHYHQLARAWVRSKQQQLYAAKRSSARSRQNAVEESFAG